MAQPTYYEVLGVPRDASAADIREAYRALAMRWHPDRNPDPEALERFKLINVAYQTLSDPETRRRHDARMDSKGAWTPDEGLSDQQAYQIFLEAMLDLGHELAQRGHDQGFILRILTNEGCPPDIAAAVARSSVRNASVPCRERSAGWTFGGAGEPRSAPVPPAKKGVRAFGIARAMFKGVRVVIALFALVYVVYILSAVSIMTGNAPKWLARAWGLMGNEAKAPGEMPSMIPGFLSGDSAKVDKLADELRQHYRSADPDAVMSDKGAVSPAPAKAAVSASQPADARGPSAAEISWSTPLPPAPGRVVPVPAAPRQPSASRQASGGADSCNTDRDCPHAMACNRASVHESWRCVPR